MQIPKVTLNLEISEEEERQIIDYLKKKGDLGWDEQRIINHLYQFLLTRTSVYFKKLGHFESKRHKFFTCSARAICNKYGIEEVQAMKRKMDFRIRTLMYLYYRKHET